MLLIGSAAAKVHYPFFRTAKDIDILGTPDEISSWLDCNKQFIKSHKMKGDHKLMVKTTQHNYEFTIVKPGSSSELFMKINQNRDGLSVAMPTTLWLLKMSHIKHPIHWEKNIEDYHFFKALNLKPSLEEWEAYRIRQDETDNRLKKKVSLDMTNEEFFKKSSGKVKRVYEHDDLHRATCYYEKPLFEMLKSDTSKAMIDQILFLNLPMADRLRTVREEAYAIALERVIIPAMEKGEAYDAEKAFLHALGRICTTLTKGWFQTFAIEHYPAIKVVDRDFVGFFKEAVKYGRIKRLNSEFLYQFTRVS